MNYIPNISSVRPEMFLKNMHSLAWELHDR